MFGIPRLFRSEKSARVPSSYRLRIDELEKRLCPTELFASSDFTLVLLPHITLSTQVQAGHVVQLTGTVTGDLNNAGVSVSFSGAASGTTTTDADGNYSFTTDTAALGTVTAVGVDAAAQSTDIALADIAVAAPALNLSITYGTHKSVTLTGTLTDIDAGGRTITFSGVAGGTATTDSGGKFSLTTTATGLGAIDANETDLWDQESDSAEVMVSSDAPVIESLEATNNTGSYWILTGTVTGPDVEGLVVSFSSNTDFDGKSATVEADGTFELCLNLPSGQQGTVTAITQDGWGQESNEIWTSVG
jgi:hypothetical protein